MGEEQPSYMVPPHFAFHHSTWWAPLSLPPSFPLKRGLTADKLRYAGQPISFGSVEPVIEEVRLGELESSSELGPQVGPS